MSDLTKVIRSRGHWNVVIRPGKFDRNRVPYDQLDEIIGSVAVRMRGWPVPFVDYSRREFIHDEDWIGQDIDASMVSHYEAWRFFTSGQFSHLRAVSADWRTGQEATRIPDGYPSVIEVWEILYYLTEVFELAARLALSPAGDDVMVISATLEKIVSRALVVGQANRIPFVQPYRSTVPSLRQERTLTRDQLIADAKAEAVEMARQFFLRFGWKPSLEQLLDHQRELVDLHG